LNTISEMILDLPEKMGSTEKTAIWKSKDGDRRVTVIDDLGVGPDGRHYVSVLEARANLVMMLLPNDHTTGTRPGYPTPRAQVADNDLALGRIVETITRSQFWNETVIFVVEDDAQDGVDHVDGHRTIAQVISPHTRRGSVDSTFYTQVNMVRTIEQILGLPAMNQFDLAATPMYSCFSNHYDASPFKLVPNQIPLDEINPPIISLKGEARYWAKQSLALDFSAPDLADEDVLNRVIWYSSRGYQTPYPQMARKAKDEHH
jgi:Phosphoesterase family